MNTLRKTLAEKYGLVADIMHDDYFFVQLPENEDHSLKFLESNLPECIRVELAECFAGSMIAAWEVPLFYFLKCYSKPMILLLSIGSKYLKKHEIFSINQN